MAKSAKSAKSDRKKVIDDITRKQKGAERRRGFMIVGVCGLVALLIVGAAAYRPVKNWWELRQFNDVDLASIGASADVCGEITTADAEGQNDHRPTGSKVEYSHAPVAFGPHWNEGGVAPAPIDRRFYTSDDRPELEALVHNLEHGYTILWYDETAAGDDSMMNAIRGIANKMDVSDTNFRFKFIAAPWLEDDVPGESFPEGQHVAFSHWTGGEKPEGIWQYCSEPSGEALDQFMQDYPYTDSPEPNAM